MPLVFNPNSGDGEKKPIRNKRQSYATNDKNSMFGSGSKPSGTKSGNATKNSSCTQETNCASGRKNTGYNAPPTEKKVTIKKTPKVEPPTDNGTPTTSTKKPPRKEITTDSIPVIPIKPKKNVASF